MTQIKRDFFQANLQAFCSTVATELGLDIFGSEDKPKDCNRDTGVINPDCPNFPKGHFVLVQITPLMREPSSREEAHGIIIRNLKVVARQPTHYGNRYEFRCSDNCGQTFDYEQIWIFTSVN